MRYQILEAKCQFCLDEPQTILVMRDEEGSLFGFFCYDGDLGIVGEEKVLAEFETEA